MNADRRETVRLVLAIIVMVMAILSQLYGSLR